MSLKVLLYIHTHTHTHTHTQHIGFPSGSDGKEPEYKAGDLGLIPGFGRSPEEGTGNPLQYSCLENPTDTGAWGATVRGVTKSRTKRLTHPPTFWRKVNNKTVEMCTFYSLWVSINHPMTFRGKMNVMTKNLLIMRQPRYSSFFSASV